MTDENRKQVAAGGQRVAVAGAWGQLGSDLVARLRDDGYRVDAFGHSELDIGDPGAVEQAVTGYDVVVNAAALTNVDLCEEQGEVATRVNGTGAYLLARASARSGSKYVLIGTDFVFGGEKQEPYLESDAPAPVNIYGASKLYGEQLSSLASPDTLIVRISSVFGKAGSRGKGGNFVEAILAKARAGETLKVIDDITMSPTYTVDVARALPHLLHANASGIVHLANTGSCTWFDFAERALRLSGLEDMPMERVSASAFPRPARRPRNSALASALVTSLLGREMPRWEDALYAYLLEKGHVPGERRKEGVTGYRDEDRAVDKDASEQSEEAQ